MLAYHEPSDTYSVRFEGDVSSFHKNADLQFLSPPTEECLRCARVRPSLPLKPPLPRGLY